MTAVMNGVRILEVAEQTFVPAASALLSDWGAEVIKIEHVERGDAMRGLALMGGGSLPSDLHVYFEHSNRGKQSLGLDLTSPEGLEILYRLAEHADVFLTNKLSSVRQKLKIDVDHIRAHNPNIIYVRGSGQGERGPDANKGSYDALAFHARAGVAKGTWRPEYELVPVPPPGFGDSIGAMTIAGGIMGALFHRERSGQATVVDVSLFGTGLWAMGQSMALSMALDVPWAIPPNNQISTNPLSRNYDTKDGHLVSFVCLQAAKYWPEFCEVIGRPELATDPRFSSFEALIANGQAAVGIVEEEFLAATLEEWKERLATFTGQWTVVQDSLEAADDPQAIANGYIQESHTAAGTPFRLVAAPVQFDEQPPIPRRAPGFNEQGDAILAGVGLGEDAVLDLKVRGVVA